MYKYKLVALSVLGVLVLPFSASALLLPQVHVMELSLVQQQYQSGESVQGMIVLANHDKTVQNDIGYDVILYHVDAKKTKRVIGSQHYPEHISLLPEETVEREFQLQVPSNAPGGNYVVSAQVVTGSGLELGWKDRPVTIISSRDSLTIGSPRLVNPLTGSSANPLDGPTFKPGDAPQASFTVSNPVASSVTAVAQVTVYKRSTRGGQVGQTSDMTVTVPGKSSKVVMVDLPALTEPESYLAEIVLLDTAHQPVSNYVSFRWVIAGQSGKILSIQNNQPQTSGRYCDVLPLSIIYTQVSADSLTKSSNLNLAVSVKNAQGREIGAYQAPLPTDTNTAVVSVPLSQCAYDPQISATLLDDRVVLDNYMIQTKAATTSPAGGSASSGTMSMVVAFIVALALGGYLYMRSRSKAVLNVLAFALLALGASITLAFPTHQAEAFTVTRDQQYDRTTGEGPWSPSDLSVMWNEPYDGASYRRSDTVDISFSINISTCFNVVRDDGTTDEGKLWWADRNGNKIQKIADIDIVGGYGADTGPIRFSQQFSFYNVSIPSSVPTGTAKIVLEFDIRTRQWEGFYREGHDLEIYFNGYARINIIADPSAPTATISPSPSAINSGQSTTLTWGSTNATSCTGTGFSTGGATSGTRSVSPSTTTNYSVSCTNGSQSATSNTTVTVNNCVAGAGSACTSVANACGMTGSGTIQCNGTCSASTPPTTFCPAPQIGIIATPQLVNPNATINVTWTTENVKNCSISGSNGFSVAGIPSSGTRTVSGSRADGPIGQTVVYTLRCQSIQDPTKFPTATSKVQIKPSFQEI